MKRKYYILVSDEIEGYVIHQAYREFEKKHVKDTIINHCIKSLDKELDKHLEDEKDKTDSEILDKRTNFEVKTFDK